MKPENLVGVEKTLNHDIVSVLGMAEAKQVPDLMTDHFGDDLKHLIGPAPLQLDVGCEYHRLVILRDIAEINLLSYAEKVVCGQHVTYEHDVVVSVFM